MQVPWIWADILGPKYLAATKIVQIGLAYTVNQGHIDAWAMLTTNPKLMLLITFGSPLWQQLGSMWMSVACVSTGVHAHHVLNHMLKYENPAEQTPLIIGPE